MKKWAFLVVVWVGIWGSFVYAQEDYHAGGTYTANAHASLEEEMAAASPAFWSAIALQPDGEVVSLHTGVGKTPFTRHLKSAVPPPQLSQTLLVPQDFQIDSFGRWYVLDTGRSAVKRFTAQGKLEKTISLPGAGEGSWPTALAFNREGLLYVADSGQGCIWVVHPEGEIITSFGQLNGTQAPLGKELTGLAVSEEGKTYLVDATTRRVLVYDETGSFLYSWSRQAEKRAPLGRWHGAAVAPTGNLYFTDSIRSEVHVYSPKGEFLFSWGKPGFGVGQLAEPKSIRIAGDAVYVSFAHVPLIDKYSLDGHFQERINGYYPTPAPVEEASK